MGRDMARPRYRRAFSIPVINSLCSVSHVGGTVPAWSAPGPWSWSPWPPPRCWGRRHRVVVRRSAARGRSAVSRRTGARRRHDRRARYRRARRDHPAARRRHARDASSHASRCSATAPRRRRTPTSRLFGQVVQLEDDVERHDIYGRRLAYVYLDGQELRTRAAAEGLRAPARHRTQPRARPRHARRRAERRARGVGLWGVCEAS